MAPMPNGDMSGLVGGIWTALGEEELASVELVGAGGLACTCRVPRTDSAPGAARDVVGLGSLHCGH